MAEHSVSSGGYSCANEREDGPVSICTYIYTMLLSPVLSSSTLMHAP